MDIYTVNHGEMTFTIEVPKGRQSAKATRHVPGQPAESRTFYVLGVDDAPTPEVQAQRWAIGMPDWKASVADPHEPAPTHTNPHVAEAATEEPTELDEASDGE